MTEGNALYPTVVVITGVAGSGKSTVGAALAARLAWRFHDADDLHAPDDVERMRQGQSLDDERRQPWLQRVRAVIAREAAEGTGAVVACSALKARYREVLSRGIPGVRFVFLDVPRGVLLDRLTRRAGHFAGPAILDSQLEAVEPPEDSLKLDGSRPVPELVDAIAREIGQGR